MAVVGTEVPSQLPVNGLLLVAGIVIAVLIISYMIYVILEHNRVKCQEKAP